MNDIYGIDMKTEKLYFLRRIITNVFVVLVGPVSPRPGMSGFGETRPTLVKMAGHVKSALCPGGMRALMAAFLFAFLFLGCAYSTFSASLPTLNIIETRWGFDGQIVKESFNQVAVLVGNDSDTAFDGSVSLLDSTLSIISGIRYVEEIYLAPHALKWIVFSPYISSHGISNKFTLIWGRDKKDTFVLPSPSEGLPSVVFFSHQKSIYVKLGLHSFPEYLFPASPSLTNGLDAAVIATSPFFSPYQAEALKDWLSAGGLLYIIHGDDGRFPVFPENLDILNRDENEFTIGAGKVKRLAVTADKINGEFLKNNGYVPPTQEKVENNSSQYGNHGDTIFKFTQTRIRLKHNWIHIYILIIIYLVLIVGVNLMIGKKSKNWKTPIVFFLLNVALFSLIFAFMGARGYGEKNSIHDMGYARNLGGGKFDVTQWMNVFATRGAYYNITNKGDLRYYANPEVADSPSQDIIHNGKNGFYRADIPLFSSVNILHRGKMPCENSDIAVDTFKTENGNVSELKFSISQKFPGKIHTAWALHKNKIIKMEMTNSDEKYTFKNGQVQTIEELMSKWSQEWGYSYYKFNNDDSVKLAGEAIAPLLISRIRGGQGLGDYIKTRAADSERLELLVLADTPESFQSTAPEFQTKLGYTLFHYSYWGSEK